MRDMQGYSRPKLLFPQVFCHSFTKTCCKFYKQTLYYLLKQDGSFVSKPLEKENYFLYRKKSKQYLQFVSIL